MTSVDCDLTHYDVRVMMLSMTNAPRHNNRPAPSSRSAAATGAKSSANLKSARQAQPAPNDTTPADPELEAMMIEVRAKLAQELADKRAAEQAERERIQAEAQRANLAKAREALKAKRDAEREAAGERAAVAVVVPGPQDGGRDVATRNYAKTDHVHREINALLDLIKVVRVSDVVEHLGLTPSNAHMHLDKMQKTSKGAIGMIRESYYEPRLGVRFRDAYSKHPDLLAEILMGRPVVRS